jgi:hypothetical protein
MFIKSRFVAKPDLSVLSKTAKKMQDVDELFASVSGRVSRQSDVSIPLPAAIEPPSEKKATTTAAGPKAKAKPRRNKPSPVAALPYETQQKVVKMCTGMAPCPECSGILQHIPKGVIQFAVDQQKAGESMANN